MQNKHQTFFSFFGGLIYGEGGGGCWLGQMPNFFQKCILRAPLTILRNYWESPVIPNNLPKPLLTYKYLNTFLWESL